MAEVDLVDVLELCRPREAVNTRLIRAIGACAFCRVVALNHQAGGGVEHLEVGRDVASFFKLVFPLAFAVALAIGACAAVIAAYQVLSGPIKEEAARAVSIFFAKAAAIIAFKKVPLMVSIYAGSVLNHIK